MLIIISLVLIEYFYIFVSKSLKKIKIKTIRKDRYSYSLIIFFIVVLISFNLIFAYTSVLPDFKNYPYGEYHPKKVSYDIKEITDSIVGDLKGKDARILTFFPLNDFVLEFNSYILRNYETVEVVITFYDDFGWDFRDNLVNSSDRYDYLIKNNSFQAEKLDTFDFVLLRGRTDWNEPRPKFSDKEYENFFILNGQILSYIEKNPDKFELFRKIKIDEYNTTIYVFKNKKFTKD